MNDLFLMMKYNDFPGSPVAKTQASSAGAPGSIPSQGTGSHMPQLRVHMQHGKNPHATAETEDLTCCK